jgi:phosphoglucosamine mutase
MAVTHTGRFVTGDELLVLFAKEHAGKTIACPVDASRVVEDATGCRVVRTRVGDAFVSETLAEEGGAWGGEASGAWIFPEMSYCPDGPYAAARLCHIVAARGPLESQLAAIPRYPLWRHSWRLPPGEIGPLMERFASALSDGKVTTLDGVRADYDEGWILARPSGTEPKVRVTVEARDERGLASLRARVAAVRPL